MRWLKPAGFICHMKSPTINRARVGGGSWEFHAYNFIGYAGIYRIAESFGLQI